MPRRRVQLGAPLNTGAIRTVRMVPSGAGYKLTIELTLTTIDADTIVHPTHPQRDSHRDFEIGSELSSAVDFITIASISQTESNLLISAKIASKIPGTGG